MDRRHFLVGALMLAGVPGRAPALAGTDATPHDVLVALGTGKTVFLEVYGTSCSACEAQAGVIGSLTSNSPGLSEAVTFLAVDFDAHKGSELFKVLTVERSGTLVVLKGGMEFGRLVGETDTTAIRDLVQTAYTVATG